MTFYVLSFVALQVACGLLIELTVKLVGKK